MGSPDREEDPRGGVVFGAGYGFSGNSDAGGGIKGEDITGLEELLGLEHETPGFDLGSLNAKKGCWASFE